jgi:DNA-binding NarL/FixJ family response regulator
MPTKHTKSVVPLRVVLVDDMPEVRRLVRTALRFRGGFEVVGEASTGVAAVTLVHELEPDLVVLDLGLPDITGRDVLTRVRESRPQTSVVIFSGADAEDRSWYEERVAGYVLKDADLDYLVDLLESVARPITAVEATIDLPQKLASVRDARSFLRARLAEWESDTMLGDASIVVSELAANAITHAASSYRVRLALSESVLRIEVRDGGAGTPEPQPKSLTDEHGRGLLMVAAVASSWGIEQTDGDHKVVWAELVRR